MARPKYRRKRGTVSAPSGDRKPLDVNELIAMKDRAKRSRRVFERDWWLNTAFISGDQFVEWNVTTDRLVEIDLPDPDMYPIRNFMLKISRTERAKILKTIPRPVALPVSDNGDDEHQARVMNAWFSHLFDVWQFERRLRTAIFWTVATGNVFLKWFWAGGMPQVAVVNPFDMYVDPYASSMMDARWMIHSMFMSKDHAIEVYGPKVKQVREDTLDSHNAVEARIFANLGFGGNADTDLPGVTANEYYQPPTEADPAGRYIVFMGQHIIYDGPFPYDHGRMPFTHIGHIERANSKYYESIMDAVRPLQIEANRAESRVIQNVNLSQGIWYLPMTLEVDQEPDGSPRQIIRQIGGDPGMEPVLITPNTIPPWVADEPQRLQMVAEDIAGQHEVSNAGVPGRVEAAQAIQLLQEADDALLKDVMHSMEEAISEGFWQTAYNTKQFGDPKIVIQAYDKSGRVEVEELMTDKIDMAFRVKVQTTTSLPSTISGKWDRVMTLVQNQLIQPSQALRLLGLTNDNPDLNDDQSDRNLQYRYNKAMLKGIVVRPNPWENHEACLDELNKFRKSAEFANAPERIKMIFSFHEYERKKQRQQVAEEEARLQALVQQVMQGGGAEIPQQPGATSDATAEVPATS
jgi:hypothetical protein